MKRYFAILCCILLFFAVGCNNVEGNDQVTETPSGTDVITTPTPVVTQDNRTESPEVTTTNKPEPIQEGVGYIKSINQENKTFKVVLCKKIQHMANELDKNGDPYGHDWLEISDTGETLTLTAGDNTVYVMADIFASDALDDSKLKNKEIAYDAFAANCTKSFYGSKLFFDFTYQGTQVLRFELLLSYYLAG